MISSLDNLISLTGKALFLDFSLDLRPAPEPLYYITFPDNGQERIAVLRGSPPLGPVKKAAKPEPA